MPLKGAPSTAEIEKLVQLVRKNAFLYDPTRSDHKDAIKAENAWKSIAEKMGKPDTVGKCPRILNSVFWNPARTKIILAKRITIMLRHVYFWIFLQAIFGKNNRGISRLLHAAEKTE